MSGKDAALKVSVFTRLSDARTDWQHLKDAGYVNPYQSYEWVSAWYETLGREHGIDPVIAVVHRRDKAVLLLPMGVECSAGIRTLSFLGHQNGNQNTGCWDADFYAQAGREEIEEILVSLCRQAGTDLLALHNVPENWHGRSHPFVLHRAAPSPSPVFMRSLPSDFQVLFTETHSKSARKKLLRKERLLRAAGQYRVVKAITPEEIRQGLDAFVDQRAKRAAKAGIPNAFSTAVSVDFLSRLLNTETKVRPLDVWFLETGGTIRATYLCIEHAGTIYSYSNSISHDDMEAYSPGNILFLEILRSACAAEGVNMLDFGLGAEPYKRAWADPVALKDSFLAVTWKGALKKGLDRTRTHAKSAIRNSDFLWPLVRQLRKWKAGLS
ncbi:GNAT family N-acetyltransferase [Roseibium marinum]|uniref:CelD/BcsL family acetyltransferase involved in cellulose biosynthesis n=1 Tax=Roseibium marinum TaxID=281252 RepID=A0A2S3UMF7_9HYPH|nr:GNAT family N-acetyltransferase [Roseibium marinum]POF28908.1 CelD/BcsL family acetyltransferase involved in cellulose biosynthesis [Roseibium marinum]